MRPKRKPTQRDRILWWLEKGHELTDLGALRLFGCRRLAARVHELKRDGHRIISTPVELDSGARVAAYRLEAAS